MHGERLWKFIEKPGGGGQLGFGELSGVPTGGWQLMCKRFTAALTISGEVLKCNTCPDLNSMKDLLLKWTELVVKTPGARYDRPETLLQIDTYKNGVADMLCPAHTTLNASTSDRNADCTAITTAFPLFIVSCEELSSAHQRLKGGKES